MTKTEKRKMMNDVEIREQEDGSRTISGYAVKWDLRSETLGYWRRFKEVFIRGSFQDSLTNDKQLALWSHDYSRVLASTSNNTLRLKEDDVGLHFEADLDDTTLGNDTYKTIKRGDVTGVSFGFKMLGEEWDESDEDMIVRKITKAKLYEVSPVAMPAYPDSEVNARSHDPYKDYSDKRDNETREKLILKTYL